MILRDFQIYASPNVHDYAINVAAFPIYEAVRLDLKRRRPRAPFVKIVIRLANSAAFAETFVMVALAICEVTVPVDMTRLAAALPAVPEILAVADDGLAAIRAETGFCDPAIHDALQRCREQDPPCSHVFDRLVRVTRSGIRCEPVLLARAGVTRVEVRFLGGERLLRADLVADAKGPLWLEDSFPMRRVRIRGAAFELLDATGAILCSLPIPSVPT
jgi:hypothetical protein